MASPREQILRLARDVFGREANLAGVLIEVVLRMPGTEIIYRETPEETREGLDRYSAELTALQRRILSVSTSTPQPRKRIAGLCGLPCKSTFHEAVRGLLDRDPPVIIETHHGIRLA
jgi:hypothetical protein